MTAPTMDPFFGTRYRTVHELANGAAGVLYVVEHRELGKRFAAKILNGASPADETALDRIRLEAQALGRLRHPNIVGITGFERTGDGTPFLVLELLKGRTLAAELRERVTLKASEALELLRPVASALWAMHAAGLIHRDVTPDNVFLHHNAHDRIVPKLLDLGSVRVQAGLSSSTPAPLAVPTRTGTFVGTLQFRSPEELQGLAADVRTDIYQLGMVLYLCLTGRLPFALSEHATTTPAPVDLRSPVPPSRLCPESVPAALDAFVLKALAFDPLERFQTVEELLSQMDALRQMGPGPFDTQARQPETASRLKPTLTRLSLFLVLVAIGAALVIAIGKTLWSAP